MKKCNEVQYFHCLLSRLQGALSSRYQSICIEDSYQSSRYQSISKSFNIDASQGLVVKIFLIDPPRVCTTFSAIYSNQHEMAGIL